MTSINGKITDNVATTAMSDILMMSVTLCVGSILLTYILYYYHNQYTIMMALIFFWWYLYPTLRFLSGN